MNKHSKFIGFFNLLVSSDHSGHSHSHSHGHSHSHSHSHEHEHAAPEPEEEPELDEPDEGLIPQESEPALEAPDTSIEVTEEMIDEANVIKGEAVQAQQEGKLKGYSC